jgi:hypothetical protein
MGYTTYQDVNSLDDVSFIAGTTFYLDYTIYNELNEKVDLGSFTLTWKMAPYGRKEYVTVSKVSGSGITAIDDYTRRVTISPSDTLSLYGKYVQQIIVAGSAITYRPAQGVITIISAIQ